MAERRDNKNRILKRGEYQKADGRYMYKYKDINGKDRFVYSWTLTQTDRAPKGKQCGKCLRELERDLEKDVIEQIDSYKSRNLTLNDCFEDYMAQKEDLKPATRSNYRFIYDAYVYKELGLKKVSDVKYSDIKKLYSGLLNNKGLTTGTINVVNTVIKPIFDIAIRDGYARSNPTTGVLKEMKLAEKKRGKKPSKKVRTLTQKEQEVFFSYIERKKVYQYWVPLLITFSGTGLRIGEIGALTWADCDFDNNVIYVRRNLTYISDEKTRKCAPHIGTPKTENGTREVPMHGTVREVLLAERKRQELEGFNNFVIDGVSGFIFASKSKNYIYDRTINITLERMVNSYNKQEQKLAKDEGRAPFLLPLFSIHCLRRTFCSRLCENETNLKFIQEVMGHSDIKTTMNIYNELSKDFKQTVMADLTDKIKLY